MPSTAARPGPVSSPPAETVASPPTAKWCSCTRAACRLCSSAPMRTGSSRGRGLLDGGVVAGAAHAEHLGRNAEIGVAAAPGLLAAGQHPRRQVGLGVEGPADADHVGLVGVEDPVDLVGRADAA